MRRLFSLAMILVIAFTMVPIMAAPAEAASSVVYVTASSANVRSGPSLSSSVVLQVYQGDAVVVQKSVSGQSVNGDSTWYLTKSGYYISDTTVSTSRTTTSTRGGSFSGHWVDVNLSTLQARAMNGSTVVYTAPVTTGKPGWATPTGTFYVLRRYPSVTMSSATIGIPLGTPGAYYVPNVQWTQYFDNAGDALHGNYWSPSDSFGNYNTSHGCVGMRNSDAKFFYDFGYLGMPVVIHY
ncbi:MAG: L,D-transpeptidase family protein [Dehalococcoidales bacterium]|nr:L,D-transpeptidase family protein [Dehalococcoidales bacterium]